MSKNDWPQGPWTDEPDEEAFEHEGLKCRIYRANSMGHLCGYVQVPQGHPLHGVGYSSPVPESLKPAIDRVMDGTIGKRGVMAVFCAALDAPSAGLLFDVHGGVTFSGELRGAPGSHWYGFDCAHCDDLSPGMVAYSRISRDGTYRDIEYVRAECRSLAEQIKALA